MQFDTVHHIAIIATEYDKAYAFYVQALGFAVLRETRRADKNDCKLDLRLGTMELELFIKPDAPPRPSYPEACGLRHLAFRVENVEQAVQSLAQKGIVCEPVRTDEVTGGRMTFFHDPDGLPLELHE